MKKARIVVNAVNTLKKIAVKSHKILLLIIQNLITENIVGKNARIELNEMKARNRCPLAPTLKITRLHFTLH